MYELRSRSKTFFHHQKSYTSNENGLFNEEQSIENVQSVCSDSIIVSMYETMRFLLPQSCRRHIRVHKTSDTTILSMLCHSLCATRYDELSSSSDSLCCRLLADSLCRAAGWTKSLLCVWHITLCAACFFGVPPSYLAVLWVCDCESNMAKITVATGFVIVRRRAKTERPRWKTFIETTASLRGTKSSHGELATQWREKSGKRELNYLRYLGDGAFSYAHPFKSNRCTHSVCTALIWTCCFLLVYARRHFFACHSGVNDARVAWKETIIISAHFLDGFSLSQKHIVVECRRPLEIA